MQTRRILLQNRLIQLQNRRIQLQNRLIQLQNRRIQLQNRRIQLQTGRIQLQTERIQSQRRRIHLQKPVLIILITHAKVINSLLRSATMCIRGSRSNSHMPLLRWAALMSTGTFKLSTIWSFLSSCPARTFFVLGVVGKGSPSSPGK